jgi:hypothetical protein
MRKWLAIGALLTALLILLFWSGILGGETLALLGVLAAGGAKLTSARKKTDKRLDETKKTIESAKDLSTRTDEEVKAMGIPIHDDEGVTH